MISVIFTLLLLTLNNRSSSSNPNIIGSSGDDDGEDDYEYKIFIANETEQVNNVYNCESPTWLWPIFELMNTTVDPCDNFYEYACGRFKIDNKFGPGENKISQFSKNDRALSYKSRLVLEKQSPSNNDSPKSDARLKVRRYYESCKDINSTNRNGIKAMRWMVEKLGGFWQDDENTVSIDKFNLTDHLIKLTSFTPNGFFYWGVASDPVNATTYSLQIFQGGLGFGSGTRDYYLNKSVEDDPIIVAYTKLLRHYANVILNKNQDEDSEEATSSSKTFVEEVVLFEQEIASIQSPKHELRNHALSFSSPTLGELNEKFEFLSWTQFFKATFDDVGIALNDDDRAVIHCTPYIIKLAALISSKTTTLQGRRMLHNYLIFRAVLDYSKYFGEKFREIYAEFAVVFEGTQGQPEYWHHCIADTDATIGFPLAAMYLDDYFSCDDKNNVRNLTKSVVAAFRARLQNATWMLNETRHFALKKLDAIIYDIGYPDWIRNSTYLDQRYENLTVTDDYAANQFHAFKYSFQKELMKLRRVENVKHEWYMTPTTANAYYASHQNKFVLPAGLLDMPFYYKESAVPTSINFGAIGAIISHELSHAIDDKGKMYDEHGDMRMWWDNETSSLFDKRAKCIIDQYDAYRTDDGMQLRGAQTVGENIADNGAIRIAFDAYRETSNEPGSDNHVLCSNKSSTRVNLTNDQLFFVTFGQMWCTVYSPESLRLSVIQDEHPPSDFRVIGSLSHFDQFSKIFNCPTGSKMNSQTKCALL